MECPNGSVCTETEHTVKTLSGAKEWFSGANENQLPLTVNQLTASNGRVQITIRDKHRAIIYTRG